MGPETHRADPFLVSRRHAPAAAVFASLQVELVSPPGAAGGDRKLETPAGRRRIGGDRRLFQHARPRRAAGENKQGQRASMVVRQNQRAAGERTGGRRHRQRQQHVSVARRQRHRGRERAAGALRSGRQTADFQRQPGDGRRRSRGVEILWRHSGRAVVGELDPSRTRNGPDAAHAVHRGGAGNAHVGRAPAHLRRIRSGFDRFAKEHHAARFLRLLARRQRSHRHGRELSQRLGARRRDHARLHD